MEAELNTKNNQEDLTRDLFKFINNATAAINRFSDALAATGGLILSDYRLKVVLKKIEGEKRYKYKMNTQKPKSGSRLPFRRKRKTVVVPVSVSFDDFVRDAEKSISACASLVSKNMEQE